MKMLFAALGAAVILAAGPAGGDQTSDNRIELAALAEQFVQRPPLLWKSEPQATEYAAECCKVCRKGKACGNSCIARGKQCHQPAGCACDGN